MQELRLTWLFSLCGKMLIMKLSQSFWKSLREAPKDETARNAQLLIRAGFVHKEMAGVYAYLPFGLRVLEKIKAIVREEMDKIGGQELLMTTLQEREIWEKTGRWDDKAVDNWFKTSLKSGTELGVGLTHEEPITDMLREFVRSYKDFPFYVYQIASKFRNELRAKSGLLRGREFLMKDMYSFARTEAEHSEMYEKAAAAYTRVYERLGLGSDTYRTVADGGYFTDKFSDEYQTVTEVGEDTIYIDEKKRLAINEEILTDDNLARAGLQREDLITKKAVEVGNIFPLESKYSDALGFYYMDEKGEQQSVIMGCYGIGVSRLMGVLVEKFSDEKGLVWPDGIAPAEVYLVPIGDVGKEAGELYEEMTKTGLEVVYDDRDLRPGEKLVDADLTGIPYRVVVSERGLKNGRFELKMRTEDESIDLTKEALFDRLIRIKKEV